MRKKGLAQLSIGILKAKKPVELTVKSSAFADKDSIPAIHAADQKNISPPVHWRAGPEGTHSYVMIMEDPDAPKEHPFVHWLVYNLPREVTALEEGFSNSTLNPHGAKQGLNDRNYQGYFGPRPPSGDQPHRYFFQTFAIDTELELTDSASAEEVKRAIAGHVLAKSACVGVYQR